MATKPQLRSKLTAEKKYAQLAPLVSQLDAVEPTNEHDRRLAESARRMAVWIDATKIPRWTVAVLSEFIGKQIGVYFDASAELFERFCPAEIIGSERERLKALNIWVGIAYYCYWHIPAHNAPVYLFLYEFLKAHGAPLPETWDAAEKARKRIVSKVKHIIAGTSKYSSERRLAILLANPCVFYVVLTNKYSENLHKTCPPMTRVHRPRKPRCSLKLHGGSTDDGRPGQAFRG